MALEFRKLNSDWNAEPNAPEPEVSVIEQQVQVRFFLNYFVYDKFAPDQTGALIFENCSRWRLGTTNDEGWYRGQCRYSGIAPEWGEFYEISGDDDLRTAPQDWHISGAHLDEKPLKHFLFYFRDDTFECLAGGWSFVPDPPSPEDQT